MQKEVPIKYYDEKIEIRDLNDKHIEVIIKIRKDYWNTINQRAKENNMEIDKWIFRAFYESAI